MAETITVLSQKGGTGKTTTVRTLTDAYRRAGLDVLGVDLDPQGNLSDYFDVPADASPTMADVLNEIGLHARPAALVVELDGQRIAVAADATLLLIDATEGVTGQDQRLAERVTAGTLAIVGVTYQLADGRVTLRGYLGDIGEG